MTKLVYFDAGHGLHTPGKRTPDDEREWSFNHKIALAAERHLESTYDGVVAYRTDDVTGKTDVSLADRVNKANSKKADVFVSIHNNALAGKWGDHTGTETYVATPASSNPKSMALANEVHPRMVKAFGLQDRGIRGQNLYVVMNTKMPAILVEGGFMDSRIDIKKLRDDKTLEKAGQAIADGVAAYLKLKKKAVQPSKPNKPPKPSKKDVYRVIVDDKQIGAYGAPDNVLAEVEKAIKADKKDIRLERV
jgi:N-acetylmuramoyl-L-alanine amidase